MLVKLIIKEEVNGENFVKLRFSKPLFVLISVA